MPNDITEEKQYTLEEIRTKLAKGDCTAFLMVMEYTIEGKPCFGSGLTLWDADHAPFLKDGKLVVKTYFRRQDIRAAAGEGDPSERIQVEVQINPNDPLLFIVFRNKEQQENQVIRCNNCMAVFGSEEELQILPTGTEQEGEVEYIKGCPTCKTEEYLMDLVDDLTQ
jgi:Pyruvate/2-oxoacid:ferredoxin oxidoreductase delta subunit